MTKEEREKAIEKLVNATFSEEWQGDEELTTAYNMAINALDHSGEYINRFDAIIQLSHDLPTCPLPKIKECLDKMPTLNDELINFHNCEHKKGEREKAIEIFIKRAKCRATASGDIIEGTDKKCSETACDQCPLFYNDDELYEAEKTAIKELKQEPREHGEWIERMERDDSNDYEHIWYECTKCHSDADRPFDFCPRCGADMRGGQNNV